MDRFPSVEVHSIGKQTRERIIGSRLCPAMQAHGLYLVGCSDAKFGFEFVRHKPQFCQILITVTGAGLAWVDGGWQRCEAGSAYVTPPQIAHSYRAIEKQDWQVCWAIVPNDTKSPLRSLWDGLPQLRSVNPTTIFTTIEGLYAEASGTGEPELLEAWVRLLQLNVRRCFEIQRQDLRIVKVVRQMHADLGADWDMQVLAEVACCSKEHLRRLFEQELGQPPMQYLAQLRMQRAMSLLTVLDEKIEAIASRVGYSNGFAFSVAFKRYSGMTPSAYRAQQLSSRGSATKPYQS